MAIFDLDALNAQLRHFSAQTPQILRRLKFIEEFAPEIERSLAIAEAPFTLAVVGQMRVGKSTLINALVGAELAIPGVTETTATVNWFRHGTPEQAGKFRVVWNDLADSSDEYDLADKHQWSGNSELAARTRFLEFFSTAEFLKKVHVVDTPGTRSTLRSHEDAARGFLLAEGRAERDSLFYGGVADCIVYVLPPVTHQNDSELLGQFTSQRRLPQSTPYNSVGVLHKWETLEHPAPWNEAVEQTRRAFQALKAYVCDVIPVSGPLARACQLCSPSFWDDVLRLVRGTSGDTLETLTMQESWFTRPEPDCTVTMEERKRMRISSHLAWPCFKTVLLLAASRSFRDGAEMRQALREISGIDRLLEFLERRFFDRSRLIRASNVLNRALGVTEAARGRLRNRLADLTLGQDLGQQALAEFPATSAFPKARAYIEQRLAESRREHDQVSSALRDLEVQAASVRESFLHFEQDCKSVQYLDDHADQFDHAEVVEILTLLGAYGAGVTERLGAADGEFDVEALHDRLDRWLVRRHEAKDERRFVLNQVVSHLEDAIRHCMRDRKTG